MSSNQGHSQGNKGHSPSPRNEENGAQQPGQRGHGSKGTGESGERESDAPPRADRAVTASDHADPAAPKAHSKGPGQPGAKGKSELPDEGRGNVGHSGKTAAQHRHDGQRQDDQRLTANEPGSDARAADDEGQPGQGSPNSTGKDDGEFDNKKTAPAVLPKHA